MLTVISVLVVLDQAEGVVAFGDALAILLKTQKASNLIDVDRHIVESSRLPGDPQALLVEVQSLCEVFVLQALVGCIFVFVKPNCVQVVLDTSLGLLDSRVIRVEDHCSIQVFFCFFEFVLHFQALCSSLKKLDFKEIVLLEVFSVILEGFNDGD